MSIGTRVRIRRAAALTAGLLAAGLAIGLLRGFPTEGKGPAGPGLWRDAFQRPWTTRPVILVGVGDSVTAGFGASPGHSYFDRLLDDPSDEDQDMKGITLRAVLPHLRFRNVSMSYTTSFEHLQHQVADLDPAERDTLGLVVMTTGGNDLIHNYGRSAPREDAMYGATLEQARPWIAGFEERLHLLVSRIHDNFPGGCLIFLANIYDPTDGVGDLEHTGFLPAWKDGLPVLQAYNDVIGRCPARHPYVHVVDMHGTFLGHGIHCRQEWKALPRGRSPLLVLQKPGGSQRPGIRRHPPDLSDRDGQAL